MSNSSVLRRDLEILEVMSTELGDYLLSDSTRWTMARGDMPRLTIGGCLMRQHRLTILQDKLRPEEQTRLGTAGERVDQVLADSVVRFEVRAHQELHARIGEWIGHLRHWAELGRVEVSDYAKDVDTRVVVASLINKLSIHPYYIDPQVVPELAAVDKYLSHCWQEGEFVWSEIWRPAYPRKAYWWLYGGPKCRPEAREPFRMDIPHVYSPER